MKIFIVIILLIPFILYGQDSESEYPQCLNITKYVTLNIENLNHDSLLVFFNQFSIKENENNIEFSEWGNEVLFEVLEDKPELFFFTLFSMDSVAIKSIESEVNSPVHDGIDLVKIYDNVEKCSLTDDIKTRALKFVKPSYEAYKKMIEDWEKKNNQKWQ